MHWLRLGLVMGAVWLSVSSCDGNTTITVRLAGGGTGRVTSETLIGPAKDTVAIDCPGDCEEKTYFNTRYKMTATPADGSRFAGWDDDGSGECNSLAVGLGPCQVNTDHKEKYVFTATFELKDTATLTVSRTGTGEGRVRSLESTTIDCGTSCTGAFTTGSMVTLEASPTGTSTFTGWSGACTGTSTLCVVTMDMARSVLATFSAPSTDVALNVINAGSGFGVISSTPSGITCGSACTAAFAPGTMVTLSAAADSDSTFTGWSGGGCSGTASCVVTLSTATTVTGTFTRALRTLTVVKAGSGGGEVTSSPAGVSCGATCAADFASSSLVTLSAAPDATSTFTGWSGGGCSGTGTCTVTLSAATTVTATFTRRQFALTVSVAGTGSGRVTSSPAAIDCGASCSANFDAGSTVTLTAAPDSGSTFMGWSGACSGTGVCTVTISAVTSVSATFTRETFDLTVVRAGTGAGTVTSSPAGVSCGATCTASFGSGTAVTLSATADATSTFSGWSGGACSGTGTCTVTLAAATTVTATFTRNRHTLQIVRAGTGSGTVTSSPAGVSCGATCSADFDEGSMVTLTATPDGTSSFAGWAGACTGSGPCVVTLSAAASVTATFNATSSALTVIRAGTGGGTVTSSPAGINCGATCSSSFTASTVVTLTASADASSTFDGWSGGGCSGTATCTVTVNAALTVTATFTRKQFTLTVAKAGTGTGIVTSSPAGLSCGATCSASFDQGSLITLTPSVATGSTFAGWSGGGCSGTGACVVTLAAATSVTATFNATPYTLTVTRLGTGGGAVNSTPSGINCGATCSAPFLYGSTVTLTPVADAVSDFSGWSGACVGLGTCTVTITAAASVSATFTRRQAALTVLKAGSGGGTVTSSPAGITCGASCVATWDVGTTITLTAAADGSSLFTGWSGGGCTGTGSCVVSLSSATTVTATFQPAATLVVTTDSSAGTVTSSPAGINCGSTCSSTWVMGTVVTLTATPIGFHSFSGWTGACSGTGPCVVTLDASKSVGATFAAITWPINVTKVGLGSVTSAPGGINCGPICSYAFTPSTSVALTATPSVGYTFAGWSGDCTGTGTCMLLTTAAKNVTATFTRPNIAFVTSTVTTGAMGGLTGADAICQNAATAASLAGTYKAWLSTTTGKANARVGPGGWVRTDGLPFANSIDDLVAGKIFYPLRLDEFGNDLFVQPVFTSTTALGTRQVDADTCGDWTTTAGQTPAGLGNSAATTGLWTSAAFGACGSSRHLYCFGTTETGAAVISPPPPAARLAFVSTAVWMPGGGLQSADSLCASEAQAAGLTGSWLALLTPLNTTAASRFSTAGAPWFRVDGVQLTSTAAQLFSSAFWAAPLNVTATGAPANDLAWTGAPGLTVQGAPGNTCQGWTASTVQDFGGLGAVSNSQVGSAFGATTDGCVIAHRLYCLQQ
ncbi:MAG: hypothetical protein U0228_20345 [Myxococcaceae bacterium]